jgi:hypothetical protein
MHFAAFALACVGVASAIPSLPYILHERRVDTPKHWEKTERLAPNVVLPMRIRPTRSNLDIAGELLMEMQFPIPHETSDRRPDIQQIKT